MDRKLQRHRADSLRQHGFLVFLLLCLGLRLIQMNKMFRACDWSGAWAERERERVSQK